MRSLSLKRMSIPKVAVLVAGLAAAILVATINPVPAQAFPSKQANCTNCHGVGTPAGTVDAVPSTTTPAAGATYTVLVTAPANADEPAGDTGYWIANSTAAGATGLTTGVYGGSDGTGAVTRTATMTAPAAAGTYYYKVWAVKGSTAPTGVTNFKVYSITVAGAPVAVTTTTALAVTPASPVVAPASPTLTATVTGAGAAGAVEFFNGTTSLGTPSAITAGVATKALTGVAAGSYSYKAVFTPTNAAAFTPSTSLVVAYLVTAAPPVVVTTTTALAVTPASPVVAPASPTLKATVTGAGAAGLVEFFNGTTSLGTSPVASGVASKALTGVAAGSYNYKAVFTPTDAALFTSSTSLVVAYLVTAAPPVVVTTTTALAVSPVTAVAPASATLTATVTGVGAAGLVEFFNGTTSLGTSAVAAGVASKALVGLGAGSYSYKAVFTPTDAALFTSSTSSVVAFVVTPAPVAVPVASFTASATSGDFPLPVTFTDTSTNTPTSWAWNLGDGTTSIVQNPSVTYTAAGTYTVTLIASNVTGASALVTQTITVTTPAPVVIPPVISALSPAFGAIGDTVTISGTGFGTSGTVMFGTTPLNYLTTATGTIEVQAPIGVRRVKVTVTPSDGDSAGVASDSVIFKYDRIPRVR